MHEMMFKSLQLLANVTSGMSKQKKLYILIYHRVLDTPDFMRPGEVDKTAFDWQMKLLAQYFNVLSLSDALSRLQSDTLPARAVCITFDDGYADNYLNALPILQKYNFNATFFIASGFLDGGRMWNDSIIETIRQVETSEFDLTELGLGKFDISTPEKKANVAQKILLSLKHLESKKRQDFTDVIGAKVSKLPDDMMLSSQQLQQLHKQGMEIGGHTINHPIMATLTEAKLQEEIEGNKLTLEHLLQTKIRYFAYPNGRPQLDYLPEQIPLIINQGYEAAFSTQWGVMNKNSDIWQLPRFTPWDNTPLKFMLRMTRMFTLTR